MLTLPAGVLVDVSEPPYSPDPVVRGILTKETIEGAYTLVTVELPTGDLFRSDGIATSVDCQCGNWLRDHNATLCDWCEAIKDEPPHTGHWSLLGGTWWCDTCNSPLCNLA